MFWKVRSPISGVCQQKSFDYVRELERMSVLMFALGIYIVGVALVLYLRPAIMFRTGGWKEFGLANTGSYTIFPFWLFTVLWAFLSYTLAIMATVFFSSLALKSAVAPSANANLNTNVNVQPISATPTPVTATPTPVTAMPPVPASRTPGYYILNSSSAAQPPQYVYFGTNPPTYEDIAATIAK